MGQGIQEWTKQNLWKTAFEKFEVMWSAEADYSDYSKQIYLVHS